MDYSRHEKDVAKILANELDVTVKMVPRILYPLGVKTPDYMINGEKWDLKRVNSRGKNAFYNALRKGKKQADNFVIELTGDYQNEWLEFQINSVLETKHFTNIRRLIIIDNMRVERTINR